MLTFDVSRARWWGGCHPQKRFAMIEKEDPKSQRALGAYSSFINPATTANGERRVKERGEKSEIGVSVMQPPLGCLLGLFWTRRRRVTEFQMHRFLCPTNRGGGGVRG